MRTLILTIVDLIFSLLIMGFSLYIVLLVHSMAFWELPYVPTMGSARKALKKHLRIKKTDRVLDMGSGLGRMVLFFAQYPIQVTGIERRKFMAFLTRIRLFFHFWKKGETKIISGDFFKTPLQGYSIIYAFHIPRLIQKLVPKIEQELQPGQTLISYKFPYPLSPRFVEEKVQDAPNSYFYIYRRK